MPPVGGPTGQRAMSPVNPIANARPCVGRDEKRGRARGRACGPTRQRAMSPVGRPDPITCHVSCGAAPAMSPVGPRPPGAAWDSGRDGKALVRRRARHEDPLFLVGLEKEVG
jgi:hypothetical protein